MGAYQLDDNWLKIEENIGVLENISQQNIEFMVVKDGVEPINNGGKTLNPHMHQYFSLADGESIWVRCFINVPSGTLPVVAVNSVVDFFNRDDNPLEGTSNFLTIGISVWRPEAWFPKDWVVIHDNAIWQCLVDHKPSEDFVEDVEKGYWGSMYGNLVRNVEVNETNIVVTFRDETTATIPITAYSSVNDGSGNNIVETYVNKDVFAVKLDEKADKSTTLNGYGITDAYTQEETTSLVEGKIAEVVAGASDKYDTLKEIADWIENDGAGITGILDDVADLKENKSDVGHTHPQYVDKSELSPVATSGSYNDLTDKPVIQEETATVVDEELSDTSLNAVQNRVITNALAGKSDTNHTHSQYITNITSDMVIDALGYTPPTSDTTYISGVGIDITDNTISANGDVTSNKITFSNGTQIWVE